MIRQLTAREALTNICNCKSQVELVIKSRKFLGALKQKISAVPRSLKDQSSTVLKVWAHQCECVVAQRLRRGQQMFSLYSKLWGETALRDFIKQMGLRLEARGRTFIAGALGVAGYDWQRNRIPDSDIQKHQNEIDYVHKLKANTLCEQCNKNSRICSCDSNKSSKNIMSTYDDWKVFIAKDDLVVWRRLHTSGNYEYKVYGSYHDVSAEDFLNVQIDVEYRRQWDRTAVALNVVEEDPSPSSNSDIIYWEMLWPKLFTNRDYVFNRRYLVDRTKKTLFLVSKSTKHPNCPKNESKYRIEDYWSYMVIKPYTELDKPGIEFSLTYYDNPGVNIPASVTTWVAMKAMPDFLQRLRDASRKYKIYCQTEGVCSILNIRDPPQESEPEKAFQWEYFDKDIIMDNTVYESHFIVKKTVESILDAVEENSPRIEEDNSENTNVIQPESCSYWRYLHPTYYFS